MHRWNLPQCRHAFQHRNISFNGHAWISSLRYGFPFGPQLGSFVHQYCSEKDLRSAPPPQTSTSSSSDGKPKPKALILDDMSKDVDLQKFSFDQSPCYAGPGWMDAKAAKLVMQRRHDAADALHCRRGNNESQETDFQPTLTFDLLRQIREMYKKEMQNASKNNTEEGLHRSQYAGASSAEASNKGQRRTTYNSSFGGNRATSALDEVFLDDAAVYTRALVYVSAGSRLARDWIAGCAALSTNHPSLITIAMQHQGSHEDLEDFARYCEIVAYSDERDCSLLPESRLCERREAPGHRTVDISGTLVSYNADEACGKCDGDGVIINLPVPLPPKRQADIIKRCLIYDAMSALHFMEFDAELLDLSRVRASAAYLQVPSHLVEQLREVVIAEHSLVSEKHRTMDTPPSSADSGVRQTHDRHGL